MKEQALLNRILKNPDKTGKNSGKKSQNSLIFWKLAKGELVDKKKPVMWSVSIFTTLYVLLNAKLYVATVRLFWAHLLLTT